MSIKEEYKKKILGILKVLFPDAQKVILFGSRARGTYQDSSDVDIAIDVGKKMPFSRIGEAKDALQSLYIPFPIDLVDFYRTSDEMKKAILEEGIVWNV